METLDTTLGESAQTDQPILKAGTPVGRYLLLEPLGKGGMGIVYTAYDPELNRKVALKILIARQEDPDSAETRNSRLQREAQALAQLTHPNIVTVYDVGTFEKHLFVAMELISGRTLDNWLRQPGRKKQEIIQALIGAGRGLSAAHKTGLIHRDFKPQNVMVNQDGSIKVLDFGLARAATDSLSSDELERPEIEKGLVEQLALAKPSENSTTTSSEKITSSSKNDLINQHLTRVGAVVGTPRYMSPEQTLGLSLCEQSDQFSFGIVLYESLFGEHPFIEQNGARLPSNIARAKIISCADANAPVWLRKIAQRCLLQEPNDRYRSMDDVISDLSRDPAITRRKVYWALAVFFAIALAFVGGLVLLSRPSAVCATASTNLVGIWDEVAKKKMSQAFLGTGSKFAKEAYDRVAKTLDDFSQKWVVMHTDTCEATHLRKEQSEHLLDLRMICLRNKLSRLQAYIEVFSTNLDAEVMDRAISAAATLGGLPYCADTKALLEQTPPPDDPTQRKIIDNITKTLARVQALEDAGRFTRAMKLADTALVKSKQVDFDRISALAHFRSGSIADKSGEYTKAEQRLHKAIEIAEKNRDALLVAEFSSRLIWTVGHSQNRVDDAMTLYRPAELALHLGGGDPAIEANLHNSMAALYMSKGDYSNARTHYEKSRALRISNFGQDHPSVGKSENNLGRLAALTNQAEKAVDHYTKAIKIWKRRLGENHIYVAGALDNLGVTLEGIGKSKEAITHQKEALNIRKETLGPKHADVALSLGNLGNAYSSIGQLSKARSCIEQGLKIYQEYYGTSEHLDIARSHYNLGLIAIESGDMQHAEKMFQTSHSLSEKVLGSKHPLLTYSLKALAEIHLIQKQTAKAKETLSTVFNICQESTCPLMTLGASQFLYAKILAIQNKHHPRINKLAKQAMKSFQGAQLEEQVKEVQQWLSNL